MAKIIGFTGHATAGKSTTAQYVGMLLEREGYRIKYLKFAEPLYDIHNFTLKRCKLPYHKNRQLLQLLGHQWGRSFSEDFWIDLYDMTLHDMTDVDIVLTDDVRYNNEADFIKKNDGVIIKIDRDTEMMDHPSESGIDDMKVDMILDNNESVEELWTLIESAFPRIERLLK